MAVSGEGSGGGSGALCGCGACGGTCGAGVGLPVLSLEGLGGAGVGRGAALVLWGSDEQRQVADSCEGGGEGVGPGPVCGQAQPVSAAVVDESGGHGQEPPADGGRDGELVLGVDAAEAGGPADDVVRDRGAGEPGAVREELA